MNVLVVDDEIKLCDTLAQYLELNGYSALRAYNGLDALKVFRANRESVDLVLLDILLPFMSGNEVLQEIRKISSVPVIMLTALEQVNDQIMSFANGADDYIIKPYSLAVVLAHMDAVLKRYHNISSTISSGNLTLDIDARRMYLNDNEVSVTPKEFDVALFFIQNVGKVFSREQMIASVWGDDYEGGTRTVDTIIKQLRRKIGNMNEIRSVYGKGYSFERIN